MKTLFRILGTAAAVAVTGAAIVALDKILNQKDPLHVEEVEFPEEAEKDAEEAEKTAEAYEEAEAKEKAAQEAADKAARSEARRQITLILRNGGTVPNDLWKQSGYSAVTIAAMLRGRKG